MKSRSGLLLGFAVLIALIAESSAVGSDFQRMKYNNPGLKVDLGVGLWAWPLPMDYDGDGDLDLVVSCPDVPYSGTYFFENPGGEAALPIFKPAKRIGAVLKNVTVSRIDGRPRVLTPASEIVNFTAGDLKTQHKLYPKATLHGGGRIRANQWSYVDYDGDGALDLIVGHGLWDDYGWDNAFDERGNWTRGPLHGHAYLLRNQGTTENPKYEPPTQIVAGDEPVDVFGMPSPNFADFDGDGDLDLLCGEFLDGFTFFENVGARTEPKYAAGRRLMHDDKPLTMHLCMIVVTSIDWDRDGDVDLVVGQEDGRVAFVEHTGKVDNGLPVFAPPRFIQQQADEVKFGALVTPVSFDWDGDGDEDLICGNTAGEIGLIENLDGGNPPKWAAPRLLTADAKTIRIVAGPNGSIQGPAEAKWGYTTLSVADWDHDGLPDIVANSIWGKVVWYRNAGTRKEPALAAGHPIEVQWKDAPPKPAWNWWKPARNELATQWRTTPAVVDWNEDGLNDLLMLDHEGYLALFRRQREGDKLVLRPGERIFRDAKGAPLRLNDKTAGGSGRRKLCVVDWDGDGHRDLLVNSTNVNLLRQTSADNDKFVTFADEGPLGERRLAGHTTSPTTVDWDGDGRRELLVGAEDGFLYHTPRSSTESGTAIAKQRPSLARRASVPNVLFIAVDDLRVELNCYGQSHVKSPHIDRLASAGTMFTRAYCQQAVCNPSRASLMTGLRLDTLGIWDLPTHFRERKADVVTLPQLFKQNGYHTQNIGKIFHNWRQDKYKGDPASWSMPAVMHYNNHGADKAMVEGELPPNLSDIPRTEMRDVPDDAYFDGRIAEKAVAALGELKDRPFFLAVGFWKPHAHFNAPKKYWDMYDPAKIPMPANPLPPQDVPDIAMHDAREILRAFKDRSDGKPTEADIRVLRHGYYAATSYVDAQIGKVLDELDRLGLRDKTIVVLWSDHGYHLGEHALWAKTSNFELDARVPLIISAPGYKPGQKTDALVELLDLYPTLADMCGLQPPDDLEGVSLRPILLDSNARVKNFALTQHPRPAYPPAGEDPEAMGYSLRTDRWRYTQWRDYQTGRVLAQELYDHVRDPQETKNLAGSTAPAAAIDELAKTLAAIVDRKVSSAKP